MITNKESVIDSLKQIMKDQYIENIESYFASIEDGIMKFIDVFAENIYSKLNLEIKKDMDNIKPTEAIKGININFLLLSDKAIAPTKVNSNDSGWDIYADLSRPLLKTNNLVMTTKVENGDTELFVLPGGIAVVSSGYKMELKGEENKVYEAQIRPRSGLASKGLTVNNAPGTIDYDFRGEVGVILINLSNEIQIVKQGDRIAQMVIAEVLPTFKTVVNFVSETERGESGFGSSGN